MLAERRETKLSPSSPLIPFHVVLLVPTLWKSPSNECGLLHPFHRLLSRLNFGKRQTVVFVVVVVEQSLSWHSMHFVGILHLFDLTRIVAVKKAAGKRLSSALSLSPLFEPHRWHHWQCQMSLVGRLLHHLCHRCQMLLSLVGALEVVSPPSSNPLVPDVVGG